MEKLILLLVFFLSCTPVVADHFPNIPPFPATSIRAHVIYAGDEVFIGYSPTRSPCLGIPIPNFQGDTEFIEIDVNNNIEITVSALSTFPCLDLDTSLIAYQFYSLGILPVGAYNIQMYWSDTSTPLPVPIGFPRLPLGENIQFEVLAPIVIPLFNLYSLITLGGILMFVSFLYLRKRPKSIILDSNQYYLDKFL